MISDQFGGFWAGEIFYGHGQFWRDTNCKLGIANIEWGAGEHERREGG